jgi:BCS1 N terminal
MMPGPGRHFIPYKNKWFWVERERQVNSVTLETGQPWEKVITLYYRLITLHMIIITHSVNCCIRAYLRVFKLTSIL